MKMGSFRDTKGKLYVDCTECHRGQYGERSCSAGWMVKRRGKAGCFLGTLLPLYAEELAKRDQQAALKSS